MWHLVRSVHVHSISTFFVAAEMREWLPLMIGGSESTRFFASQTTGKTGEFSMMCRKALSGELFFGSR